MSESGRRTRIFQEAIDRWGLTSQILMLAEESTELATAALHLTRNMRRESKEFTLENLADEIADVENCIDQLVPFLSLGQIVEAKKIRKIDRLEAILNDATG